MEHLNLVYKGAHSNSLYTAYFDGSSWHGNTQISSQPGSVDPQSNYNPGVVVFNNWLYLIYKAAGNNDLCCAWHDGTKWNGGIRIGQMLGGISPQSPYSPNVAVFNGLLYITYLAPNASDVYTAWFDGTTWYGNLPISRQDGGISPKSAYNPAVCTYRNRLYIVYPGTFSSDLYFAYFDGIRWFGNAKISSQPGGISPASSYSPGICVYNNRLYIVYLGSFFRDMYTAYFDGSRWHGNTTISSQPGGVSPASNYNPAMDVYRGKLYLAYKGSHSNSLYTAEYDGSAWSGNTTISSQPGGINPGTNYNPGIAVSATIPGVQVDWLERVPDATLIGDINLPGTHDAAAINSSISTPYACHNVSISKQLEYGIRILDVRLKVKKSGSSYRFVTCHGDIGFNEYQPFPSLMDECKAFLQANAKETIVMSLKVDDWNEQGGNKDAVYTALQNLLSRYPTVVPGSMPTLGSVRGKIVLLNRINNSMSLGVPISWQNNTSGSMADSRYPIYVQDQYEDLPLVGSVGQKCTLVTTAFQQKNGGNTVLNFASATWYGVFGVYIMGDLLDYFGSQPARGRPARFGWIMFDYAFNKYNTDTYGDLDIVSIVIASNFGYQGYGKRFKVVDDGREDL